MVTRKGFLIVALVLGAASIVAAGGCDTIFGNEEPATLRVPAPPLAFFPGMTDTVIAYLGYQRLDPTSAEWGTSNPSVLSVDSFGVVRAEGLGSAWIRLRMGEQRDSISIDVVEMPAGRIAFAGSRVRGGSKGLWTINPDGTGRKQHLKGESAEGSSFNNPDFSPDGCRLVLQLTWIGDYPRIMVTNVRTGERYGITSDGGAGPPTWSPDGRTIAFSGFTATGFEMFTAPADGEGELSQRSSFNSQTSAVSTDFLPSSNSLVLDYGIRRNGAEDAGLYIFQISTGALTSLLDRPELGEQYPSISPNGQWVAFTGRTAPKPDGQDGAVQIFNIADGSVRTLTPPLRVYRSASNQDGYPTFAGSPAFSPDGDWIAFIWNRDSRFINTASGRLQTVFGEIYVVRRDGRFPVRVTHVFWAHSPAWGRSCETAA